LQDQYNLRMTFYI